MTKLPDHDPELFDCYPEEDGFRLVPVPAFRHILLARVDIKIAEKHGLEDVPGWKALEYAQTVREANDCISFCETNQTINIPIGMFPCLDAMIGTITYTEPTIPDEVLEISTPFEAAQVIYRRLTKEAKRFGIVRRERLALKRAIRDAKTDEEALKRFRDVFPERA